MSSSTTRTRSLGATLPDTESAVRLGDIPTVEIGTTNRSTDNKQASFGRWSQSFSAQRHRELGRLNQIEEKRQFLELRRQNDLFEHMKSVVEAAPTLSGTSATDPPNGSDRMIVDGVLSSAGEPELSVVDSRVKLPESWGPDDDSFKEVDRSSGELDGAQPQSVPLHSNDASGFSKQKVQTSRITSFPETKEPEKEAGESAIASKPVDKGKATELTKTDYNSRSPGDKRPTERARQQVAGVIEQQSDQVQSNSSQLAGPRAPSITSGQLALFVGAQVPRNKRVLCLIVRDKMSRLNKAKSYFYPTYYLFIQAIVDIDSGSASYSRQRQQVVPLNEGPFDLDDLLSEGDETIGGSIQLNKRAPAGLNQTSSTENSFSASSSISADMLFIEPSRNGTGANQSAGIGMTGNSYSDNEICFDTEAEDEMADLSAGGGGHAIQLQGSRKKIFQERVSLRPMQTNRDSSESGSQPDLVNGKQAPISRFGAGLIGQNAAIRTTKCQGGQSRLVTGAGSIEIEDDLDGDDVFDEDDDDDDDSDNDELDNHFGNNKAGRAGHGHGNGGAESALINTRRKPAKKEEVNVDLNLDLDLGVDSNAENGNKDSDVPWWLFENDRNPYKGTYGVLLAGRRRKKAKTYLIGLNEHGYNRKNSICKLKSNILGTQFNAIRLDQSHNNDNRSTITSITYETNVLGFKGPRKMRVLLAKVPGRGSKNLQETFKKNPSAVVQLKNMTPSWNVESQSYVLNFHGRVTQASVKNFQLIECEEQSLGNQLTLGDVDAVGGGGGKSSRQDNAEATSSATSSTRAQQQQAAPDRLVQTKTSTRNDWSIKQSMTDRELDYDGSMSDIRGPITLANSGGNVNCDGSLSLDKNQASLMGDKSLTYNSSIVMQFGRVSNHEFACDVTYPLSILQAFSIALSSFDSKLACE